MGKNNRNKTRSAFWYAGLCVGSTVLAGKKVTDALGSGVSTVGGVCRRAFLIERTAAKDAVECVCQEIEQVPCPTQEDHAVRAENVVERRESRGRTGSLALSGGPRRRS